jgi:hypothetical protein
MADIDLSTLSGPSTSAAPGAYLERLGGQIMNAADTVAGFSQAKALMDMETGRQVLQAQAITLAGVEQFKEGLDQNIDYQHYMKAWDEFKLGLNEQLSSVLTFDSAKQKYASWWIPEEAQQADGIHQIARTRTVAAAQATLNVTAEQYTTAGDEKNLLDAIKYGVAAGIYSASEASSLVAQKLPKARYNKVYNVLSKVSPETALTLLKSPDDAKTFGIDTTAISPEQLDAMTKVFQEKRDYAQGVQKKQDEVTVGQSDMTMLKAEIALLNGKDDPKTWLSNDMILQQEWPGTDGARKAQTWVDTLKSDLASMSATRDTVKLEEAWKIAYDRSNGWTDEQKNQKIRALGIPSKDLGEVLAKVDYLKNNPKGADSMAAIQNAYSMSMAGQNVSTQGKKDLALELYNARQTIENMIIDPKTTQADLDNQVQRILQGKALQDLESIVKGVAGQPVGGYATGEYRAQYQQATMVEYLREQGKAPAGSITPDVLDKAKALEHDALSKAGLVKLEANTTTANDKSTIYSDKPILRDKNGRIIADPAQGAGKLYQVRYQVKDGKYIPTVFAINLRTGAFDQIEWEWK